MMERRSFLKVAGSASASTLLMPSIGSATASVGAPNTNVYEVYDKSLVSGTKPDRKKVNGPKVKTAVDALVRKMGNAGNVGQAWQNIFTGISKSSKIAIKVNTLWPNNSPHLATLQALINGLKSMFGGTFPAGNISLFDNNLWGNNARVQSAFGSANLGALGIWAGKDTYSFPIKAGGASVYVSARWHSANYHINFLVPRPHKYYAGRLSGHIKNMMGAVSIQKATYKAAMGSAHQYFHDNKDANFSAYRDLFKYIKANSKCVYLSDMIMLPVNEAANYMEKVVWRLALGTDPCAMDANAVDIMKKTYGTYASKKVPDALAKAGIGNPAYKKVVVAMDGSTTMSRDEVNAALKNAKSGKANVTATQGVINSYMGK